MYHRDIIAQNLVLIIFEDSPTNCMSTLRNYFAIVKLYFVRFFFKVILRISVNNSGVFVGAVPSDMPSLAFVCDERA